MQRKKVYSFNYTHKNSNVHRMYNMNVSSNGVMAKLNQMLMRTSGLVIPDVI